MKKSEWTLWPDEGRLVHKDGRYLHFTPMQSDILHAIFRAHGHVARVGYVVDFVWGQRADAEDMDPKEINVLLCKIRKMLKEANVDFIVETVYKIGFSVNKNVEVRSIGKDVKLCPTCGRPFDAPPIEGDLRKVGEAA